MNEEYEKKCKLCAFVPANGECGSPWSAAEIQKAKNVDPCYEGWWLTATGFPADGLKELLLKNFLSQIKLRDSGSYRQGDEYGSRNSLAGFDFETSLSWPDFLER